MPQFSLKLRCGSLGETPRHAGRERGCGAHSERWVTNYTGHIGNTLGFFWEVPRDAMEGDLCDGRENEIHSEAVGWGVHEPSV